MYLGVILIAPFICLSTQYVTNPYGATQADGTTQPDGAPQPDIPETSESSNVTTQSERFTELTNLEKTLTSLNDLVTAHRQVWEKQLAHEEQVRTKNKEEEEREATHSRALEKEQIILRERGRNLSRKVKLLSTKFNYFNGQSGSIMGDTSISSIFNKAKDCSDIFLEGDEASGVYRLWPTRYQDGRGFSAYCDMDTDGGGWTVIHRRIADGFLANFYARSWNDYKHGFGDLESSFWLGNEQLHHLTNQGAYELRLDIEENKQEIHSVYQSFFIEDETTNYKLHIEGYQPSGTAGDVMMSYNGANFSTRNQNNLPKHIVSKRVYNHFTGENEIVQTYVAPSGCAESNACGWWFNTDCKLDPKLKLTNSMGKMEMKIRQRVYSQRINDSKQSVPLIR